MGLVADSSHISMHSMSFSIVTSRNGSRIDGFNKITDLGSMADMIVKRRGKIRDA